MSISKYDSDNLNIALGIERNPNFFQGKSTSRL